MPKKSKNCLLFYYEKSFKKLEKLDWKDKSILKVFYLPYYFMISRKVILSLCAITTVVPLCSNATENINWLPVTNCLEMSRNLDAVLQNPALVESEAVAIDETKAIDEWISDEYSSSYFVDYSEKTRSITLLVGPKDPKWSTVDFKLAKKIGIIKLPATFKNIRTRIYDNKYLIIFWEHNDSDKRTESIVIFYDISDWKLTPASYFTHTWKLIKVHIQDGKLFVITNSPLDKSVVQSFTKKDGNLPSMFPKYKEWVKYGVDPVETTSVCRNYNYLQMPTDQMPSFWGIIVVNINNLKIAKELYYLLWTISQFEFSEKALYMTVPWNWETTIVQKFWIDPKINPLKSVKIDGVVLWWGLMVKDMKTAFITKMSSWKINQYSLVPFNENFLPWEWKILYTSEDNFSDVEQHWTSIVLKNRDKIVTVAELADSGLFTHKPMELPLKEHKYCLFWSSPLTILDVSSENSEISFSLYEKDKPQWKFRRLTNAKYSWEWRVIWPISWNAKTRTLMVPVKISWSSAFEWLKILQLSSKWAISELMSRSYWSSTVEVVKQLQDFSYAITDTLVDIFLSNNSISKKVFSRVK